jgi:hypothetical protein
MDMVDMVVMVDGVVMVVAMADGDMVDGIEKQL